MIANTSRSWIEIPYQGDVLVASGPFGTTEAGVRIGPDTTVWLQT